MSLPIVIDEPPSNIDPELRSYLQRLAMSLRMAGGLDSKSFSATPEFDAEICSMFKMTLTANVTSSTIKNGREGQELTLVLAQDGAGGRTFVWPTNVVLADDTLIKTTATAVTKISLKYDGTNWYETRFSPKTRNNYDLDTPDIDGGTADGMSLGASVENTISPDQGHIPSIAMTKWSTLQDTLFRDPDVQTYFKSDMGGVSADVFQGYCRGIIFQDKIYRGTYNATAATDSTGAKLIVYDIAAGTWSTITKATIGFVNADSYVTPLAVTSDGKLWVGTYNVTAATDGTAATVAYTTNGTSWTRVLKSTMGGVNADLGLAVVGNAVERSGILYISTYNTTAATDATAMKLLVCTLSTMAWTTITKATMGAHANDQALVMCIYPYYSSTAKAMVNWIAAGTYNTTAATDATGSKLVWYSGAAWSVTNKASISPCANADNLGYYHGLLSHYGVLFVSTYNTTAATDSTAAKILPYCGVWGGYRSKALWGGSTSSSLLASMTVYAGRLIWGLLDTTAATDYSGSFFSYKSGWSSAAMDGYYPKPYFGGVNADTNFVEPVTSGGRMWFGIYNVTAATDNTASKMLRINMPIIPYSNECRPTGC